MQKRPRSGLDDITVEKLEVATIDSRAEALLRLFREIWEHRVIPTEWKHRVIIHIYKTKDKLTAQITGTLVCHATAARAYPPPFSCKG